MAIPKELKDEVIKDLSIYLDSKQIDNFKYLQAMNNIKKIKTV